MTASGSATATRSAAPESEAKRRLGWPAALALSAIALGLVLDFAFWLRPGPFLIDEVTYDLMAKSAAAPTIIRSPIS